MSKYNKNVLQQQLPAVLLFSGFKGHVVNKKSAKFVVLIVQSGISLILTLEVFQVDPAAMQKIAGSHMHTLHWSTVNKKCLCKHTDYKCVEESAARNFNWRQFNNQYIDRFFPYGIIKLVLHIEV